MTRCGGSQRVTRSGSGDLEQHLRGLGPADPGQGVGVHAGDQPHGRAADLFGAFWDEACAQDASVALRTGQILLEINRPELAGNIFLNWNWGDLRVGWQSQFLDEMLYGGIEVETADTLYGPTVFQDSMWIHDINASYLINDGLMVYGGIKNVTEEVPFITELAFPASPRGRFYFIGLDWSM